VKKLTTAVFENGVFRPKVPEAFVELKDGEEVLITVRTIVTDPVKAARLEAKFLKRMRAKGLLDESPIEQIGPPIENYIPPVIEGEMMSDTVIRMRGEG
jgi:predicted DNA-binding antitoxin AbrB/MazE fold protein